MLHLLVDTSTWLDLAKRRDGIRLLAGVFAVTLDFEDPQIPRLDLLVPQIVVDEFERNRPRVEASMTSDVSQRFKLIRRDLAAYGSEGDSQALEMLDQLAHQVPLIGAMTSRNFNQIREILLHASSRLTPSTDEHERVVQRALSKTAPFHRNRNSVADALLIEMYATAVAAAGVDDRFGFVTSNSDDFSAIGGDSRQPHNDLADLFAPENSTFYLGVEGLEKALISEFGDSLEHIIGEEAWTPTEEPRRLDEILAAERELFDRIWYDRSMRHEEELLDAGDDDGVKDLRRVAGPGRARVVATYGLNDVGPYDKFEWGMLNGKLSALRWILGSEWDFLDT
jgi:hypothetical protein